MTQEILEAQLEGIQRVKQEAVKRLREALPNWFVYVLKAAECQIKKDLHSLPGYVPKEQGPQAACDPLNNVR